MLGKDTGFVVPFSFLLALLDPFRVFWTGRVVHILKKAT